MDNSNKILTINDPIHGVMQLPKNFGKLVRKIIENPIYQRLRHIKQKGMVELIFPSATHNRFAHSLGAAYVASQMIESINAIYPKGDEKKSFIEEDAKKHIIAAALLHDIGHGPFSHAFEKLFDDEKNKEDKSNEKIRHEDWTEGFLKRDFKEILEENELNWKIINALIKGDQKYDYDKKSQKWYPLACDIISSQLDADKLDYLLRDSHFCGVVFGNIDIKWIISQLRILEETDNPKRLAISEKGCRAVEHLIVCRTIFRRNVAYHKKVQLFEKLLILFLKELREFLIQKNRKKIKGITSCPQLFELLKASKTIKNKKDFISEYYDSYKVLTDYDIWVLIRDFALKREKYFKNTRLRRCHIIANEIYSRELHYEIFRVDKNNIGAVEKIIKDLTGHKHCKEYEIVILDKELQLYESNEDPLIVLDDFKVASRIQKHSQILSLLGDKIECDYYLAIKRNVNEFCKKELKNKLKYYIPEIDII